VQAFAGMHDTILKVEKDQVHNAIKSCWASALFVVFLVYKTLHAVGPCAHIFLCCRNQRVGSYATDLSYLPPFGVVVQVMIDAQSTSLLEYIELVSLKRILTELSLGFSCWRLFHKRSVDGRR
jgi:hypothetical protein